MSLGRAPEVDVRAELEALKREIERLRVEKLQDRTLLDAVLRFSPHGILVADPSGRIFVQNPAAERIWAGSATTTSVRDWAAYRAFHPDGRPYEAEDWPMARCLVEGATIEAQSFDILRFDGTRGRLVGSSAPLRDDEGRITGAVSIFVDVTELRRSEEARHEHEHRYRQLLDSVQDMVFCKNLDLRVVYANRATCSYYGMTEDELRGRSDVAFNDPDFIERYVRDDLRVIETGEPVEVTEEPNLSPSGEVQYFHTIKSPVRDGAGRIVEIVGVSRNITERRRADRRLRAHHAMTRLLSEREDLSEALPELLGTIGGGLEAAVAAWWQVEDTGVLRCAHFWSDDSRAVFEEASRALVLLRGDGLPGRVWAERTARWIEDVEGFTEYDRYDAALSAGLVTAIAFPVHAGGEVLGVIEVLLDTRRRVDEDVLGTVQTMGAQIGMFARRARERSQREFLAQASEMFSRSLDPLATLAELTRLAVPRLGDWCAVDMLDPNGAVARIAVHHSDPAKLALAHEIVLRWPPDPNAPTGVPNVLRTGRSEFVPVFPEAILDDPSVHPDAAAILRRLGLRSYVVVPLTSRGRTLGALTLVHAESGRVFDANDLAVAEELATRAALAIDNARLYADAEAARRHLASLFSQAPAPVLVVRGASHRVELANAAWCALTGRSDVLGRPLAECVPAGWRDLVPDVATVMATGQHKVVHEQPFRMPGGEERWFNLVHQPMRSSDGIDGVMVLAADVTAQVEARRREEQARAAIRRRTAQLALAAAIGVATTEALDMRTMLQRCSEALVEHLDAAFARVWTLDEAGGVLELQASAGLYTHLDGPHARVPVGKLKIGAIAASGEPLLTNDVGRDPRIGDPDWARREGMIAFAGYPLLVEGRVIGVMAMFARQQLPDDTLDLLSSVADTLAIAIQRQRAERLLRDETEALETLNRLGQSLAAELDQDRLVQAIVDSATRLSGAQFGAFFYNLVDEAGERYTLYAISGAPREAFSRFAMPRNTAVFAPTFAGKDIVRSGDITKDPRYGHSAPHHGMPAGHLPVRSYLAVPVVSRSGEVIGGLFFGHAQPGVFTARSERLVSGLAAQSAVAMDNARMFRESKQLIAALERSNAELDQFAYVASHDLKAPLRGIANLSVWLEEDLGATVKGESKRQLELLRGRVKRMEALIDGVLDYSRAGRVRSRPEDIDTRVLLKDIVDLVSPRPPARIELRGELPILRTERTPLQQVLLNLVANALKHGERQDLTVVVSAAELDDAVEFRVADDGVGIAPEFHERIWGIFQTLQARDKVESTGIGLALVKKIVESRGGRVRVESVPGQGACFVFTWPKTTAEVRRP